MTGPSVTATTTLSDKLALVTHHHLLTWVPVKLDFDEWNYGSWEYFFDELCESYEKRLVIARPKTAKEAWSFLSDLVESLMTTLASLNSLVSDDDVVHYVIDGLPEMYNQVCGYMHYQDTFPDFKTVRSLLTAEEMRLKSKSLVTRVDSSSSSPMVLLADSGVLAESALEVIFMCCKVLFRCDSTGDLYPVTAPSPILYAFLVSQHTWHHRLGHPGSKVLRRLVSSNSISCNKEKPPVLCHAC
ncbi:ribonuclease H-like domain-containing protein [Tanacetum coccineum]